jgi:hypothetical protein
MKRDRLILVLFAILAIVSATGFGLMMVRALT